MRVVTVSEVEPELPGPKIMAWPGARLNPTQVELLLWKAALQLWPDWPGPAAPRLREAAARGLAPPRTSRRLVRLAQALGQPALVIFSPRLTEDSADLTSRSLEWAGETGGLQVCWVVQPADAQLPGVLRLGGAHLTTAPAPQRAPPAPGGQPTGSAPQATSATPAGDAPNPTDAARPSPAGPPSPTGTPPTAPPSPNDPARPPPAAPPSPPAPAAPTGPPRAGLSATAHAPPSGPDAQPTGAVPAPPAGGAAVRFCPILGRPHPASPAEQLLAERMLADPLLAPGLRFNAPLRLGGQRLIVDALLPGLGLAVEVDGYRFHRGRRAFEGDRRRDYLLMCAGWRVLRLTAQEVLAEPDAALAKVRAVAQAPRRPDEAPPE